MITKQVHTTYINHACWQRYMHLCGLRVVICSDYIPMFSVFTPSITPSKTPVVSLSKKLSPNCLVLGGSRIGIECDIIIKLKQLVGLMEFWLICQISPIH